MGIRIYVRAVFGFCPQVTELEFHVNLIGPPLYFHKTLVKDPRRYCALLDCGSLLFFIHVDFISLFVMNVCGGTHIFL